MENILAGLNQLNIDVTVFTRVAKQIHEGIGQDKKHYFHMPGECSRMVAEAKDYFDTHINPLNAIIPDLKCETFWVVGYLGITKAAYDFLKFPKFEYYHEAILFTYKNLKYVYDPTWLQFDKFHIGVPLFMYNDYRNKWITISLEHDANDYAEHGDVVCGAHSADMENIENVKDKFYWIRRLLFTGSRTLHKQIYDKTTGTCDINLLPKDDKLIEIFKNVEFNSIKQIEFCVDNFNDCVVPLGGLIYYTIPDGVVSGPYSRDDNKMFIDLSNKDDMFLVINAYLHLYKDYVKSILQEDFGYSIKITHIDA